MVNPLQAAKRVGQVAQFPGMPTKSYQFHAKIMIQMHMHGGNHTIRIGVLQVQKLVGDFGFMVIVYKGKASRHMGMRIGAFAVDQFFPNKVPYRLTSGGKLSQFAKGIKLFQQVRFQRNRKSHNLRHEDNS